VSTVLTPELVRAAGLPGDPDGLREWLARFHARKTAIFREIVEGDGLRPRPGVVRVVDAALEAGWTLAVASTASEESVRVVLETVLGPGRVTVRLVVGRRRRRRKRSAIYQRARAPGRRRRTPSWSRTRATGSSPRPGRPPLRDHRHTSAGEDCRRGPRRPGLGDPDDQ
jgi:hypothetical protein